MKLICFVWTFSIVAIFAHGAGLSERDQRDPTGKGQNFERPKKKTPADTFMGEDYRGRQGIPEPKALVFDELVRCVKFPNERRGLKQAENLCAQFLPHAVAYCLHTSKWLMRELLIVEEYCRQRSYSASKCLLKKLELPLSHPVFTSITHSSYAERYPYVIRSQVSADEIVELRLLKDEVTSTHKFFKGLLQSPSTLYTKITESKTAETRDEAETAALEPHLIQRVRHYYLTLLEVSPHVEPLILKLLVIWTAEKCADLLDSDVIFFEGEKRLKQPAKEILEWVYDRYVQASITFELSDCTDNRDSNCTLLELFLHWKTAIIPQLRVLASGEEFIGPALDVIQQQQSNYKLTANPALFPSYTENCIFIGGQMLILAVRSKWTNYAETRKSIGLNPSEPMKLTWLRRPQRVMEAHGYMQERLLWELGAVSLIPNAQAIKGTISFFKDKETALVCLLTGDVETGTLIGKEVENLLFPILIARHPGSST